VIVVTVSSAATMIITGAAFLSILSPPLVLACCHELNPGT
jgi:hypothetical protein